MDLVVFQFLIFYAVIISADNLWAQWRQRKVLRLHFLKRLQYQIPSIPLLRNSCFLALRVAHTALRRIFAFSFLKFRTIFKWFPRKINQIFTRKRQNQNKPFLFSNLSKKFVKSSEHKKSKHKSKFNHQNVG